MTSMLQNRALHIEEIDREHLSDAITVLDSAARWLSGKGVEQWPASFSGSPKRCAQLAYEAEAGNLFVGYVLNRPMGTMVVTDWQDPDFASGWPEPDLQAQYILRLAVSEDSRRLIPGLGIRLLDWALHLAEIRGASVLRLDCSKTNTRLHEYYEENDFVRIGKVEVPGRKSGMLFERRIHG